MIRDRLKRAARKAAVRLLDMEFDVEERDPRARTRGQAGEIDESVIPKVVDGAGDTPGPKHLTDIGRTWVAAQLVSGEPPHFVDIRPPAEVVTGVLPGARLAPGDSVLQHPELLPDKGTRVVVYDQTGDLGSAELAERLRQAGWTMARRLQGGFAEWIEHGEPTEPPRPLPGTSHRVGDPVVLADGRAGHVLRHTPQGLVIWLSEGGETGPLAADALST